MSKPTVLVVDDEPDLVELVSLTLNRMNLDTRSAGDLAGARALLQSETFDLCLTDMRLPDGDGLDLVAWIQEHRPQLPVAVITAHGNVEAAVRALKLGAFDFVSKPLDLGVMRKLVASAIRLGTGAAARRGKALVGQSAAMAQVRDLVARVARSQAPVYISGESGVGKELVARLVHESGPRREGPFVPVNCGAIPGELMESELFGHKRGAFTGAIADSKGLVQSAEGGTLFLDEVADLPLHMQVKLLRLIQEKTIRPVGESRELPVDVRILSATHKDLAMLVAQGRFREDLYYRVNVIELRVPALRERVEDIPELAEVIIDRLAQRLQLDPPSLSAEALQQLASYPFPGNVRELENVLERAMTLCDGNVIGAADIQLRDLVRLQFAAESVQSSARGSAASDASRPVAQDAGTASPTMDAAANGALGSQLEEVERAAIIRALEQTRYNKTAAAKLLGMTFRALRYRIKKLGIE
ncbi:MAG: sigma-54 dependent transcriptional regulator [Steroidobacteraceae bacterium]|nr:sigma-54-dependent Fis family transcriptional regulator [Nevskiaceae bacterium]MCP5359310.1 sigma-54-dependent Fis family transcriptional regulator [Nevskiaceae bacterium]MCP5471754.1 sigma-54-dependent Fis family transcriptional regulator [Nevskiaceae bacterium]